jgi:two-component system response regulator MprA
LADTVLVIDDDAWLQETLEAVLGLGGYEVEVASDGAEALEKLRARRPDVILLDWAMPCMDGPAFAAALQQRGLHPGIPILILTADGHASQKAAQVGAEGYMTKPFEMTALLGEVARLAAS